MFNGMMDPELMRMAQEQMSRMSPAELAKIQQQMMSNPELIKMASESMKNMRPEDLKSAAEQLKHTRTEDMLNIGEKIANASPEEIAAMGSQADARIQYELRGAQMVKNQGNELHSQGKYSDAAEKYLLAKNNLKSMHFSKGRALQLACSLNLMSCYLKTHQYDDCVKEGSEVLQHDAENVKALYRRGQAYKELGMLQDAVSDLSKALKVSPEDETIANVLRDAQERLSKEGGGPRASSGGLKIEEIIEENVNIPSLESNKSSPPKDNSVAKPPESEKDFQSQVRPKPKMGSAANAESLQGLTDNPEAIRSFQNFISQVDPDTLASLGGSSAEGVPPDMIKTASSMIGKMSPEELQNMIKMASSFQGKVPFPSGTREGIGSNSKSGPLPQDFSPDMLKSASDMMANMPPETLKQMFEVASSLKGNGPASSAAAASANRSRSDSVSRHSEEIGIPSVNRSSDIGESSSFPEFPNFGADPSPSSSFPTPTSDMQAQMRNQMKDPAMRQMLTSMIKNMNPEMMANMSEQFGVKLSREDAEKAQQAMSSLSPDALEKMMKWADRIQTGVESAKKTKNWLLGRRGMILAICMLVLAIILHRLGYIGS